MRQAIQILRVTPAKILNRARATHLVTSTAKLDYDKLKRPHVYVAAGLVCPPPHGTGMLHKVEARLYNPFGSISPTWISCDCGNFCFTWEVALTKQHSSSHRYSNGKWPKIRNSRGVTAACKHAAKLISWAIRSAEVRKILFSIPVDELKRIKPIMDQRGIPQKLPMGTPPKTAPKRKKAKKAKKAATPTKPAVKGPAPKPTKKAKTKPLVKKPKKAQGPKKVKRAKPKAAPKKPVKVKKAKKASSTSPKKKKAVKRGRR